MVTRQIGSRSSTPGLEAVNLQGWHLTDDRADLTNGPFPTRNWAQVSFLSFSPPARRMTDGEGNLHTNFALSQDGEYWASSSPTERRLSGSIHPRFLPHLTDVSYGLLPNQLDGAAGYFDGPTPGATNPSAFSLGPRIGDVIHARVLRGDGSPDGHGGDRPDASSGRRCLTCLSRDVPVGGDGRDGRRRSRRGPSCRVTASTPGWVPAGVAAPGEMLRYYIRGCRQRRSFHAIAADRGTNR